MSGHTPGPWLCRINWRGVWTVHEPGKPGVGIAACWKHSDSCTQTPYDSEANARLIAAAPEMLEALREITKLRYVSKVAVEVAEKAIAKAEGR